MFDAKLKKAGLDLQAHLNKTKEDHAVAIAEQQA